jgi:hypothetical protein
MGHAALLVATVQSHHLVRTCVICERSDASYFNTVISKNAIQKRRGAEEKQFIYPNRKRISRLAAMMINDACNETTIILY